MMESLCKCSSLFIQISLSGKAFYFCPKWFEINLKRFGNKRLGNPCSDKYFISVIENKK